MSTGAPLGPPTTAFIELAKAGNAIERLVDLTAMSSALKSHATHADLYELTRLRAELRPEAQRQAEALLLFFQTHGDAIDAMVADAASDGREWASGVREGFSEAGAAAARALIDQLTAAEGERAEDEDLCSAIGALVFQADVMCIRGSKEACLIGDRWAGIGDGLGCS